MLLALVLVPEVFPNFLEPILFPPLDRSSFAFCLLLSCDRSFNFASRVGHTFAISGLAISSVESRQACWIIRRGSESHARRGWDEATPLVVSVFGEVGPAPVRVGFCCGGSGH